MRTCVGILQELQELQELHCKREEQAAGRRGKSFVSIEWGPELRNPASSGFADSAQDVTRLCDGQALRRGAEAGVVRAHRPVEGQRGQRRDGDAAYAHGRLLAEPRGEGGRYEQHRLEEGDGAAQESVAVPTDGAFGLGLRSRLWRRKTKPIEKRGRPLALTVTQRFRLLVKFFTLQAEGARWPLLMVRGRRLRSRCVGSISKKARGGPCL